MLQAFWQLFLLNIYQKNIRQFIKMINHKGFVTLLLKLRKARLKYVCKHRSRIFFLWLFSKEGDSHLILTPLITVLVARLFFLTLQRWQSWYLSISLLIWIFSLVIDKIILVRGSLWNCFPFSAVIYQFCKDLN